MKPWWALYQKLKVFKRFGFIVVSSLLFSIVLVQIPLYHQVQRWLTDNVYKLAAVNEDLNDIVLIDIDEISMQKLQPVLGAWPYDRGVYALITGFLADAKARNIAFDVQFSDARYGDEEFAKAIRYAGNVILASIVQDQLILTDNAAKQRLQSLAWKPSIAPPATAWQSVLLPQSNLLEQVHNAETGIISVNLDQDGVLRKIPLLHQFGDYYLPALPLKLLFMNQPAPEISFNPKSKTLKIGKYQFPVDEHGAVLLRFPKNMQDFNVIPFYQLVVMANDWQLGKQNINLEPFKNKVVFIGSSAAFLGDYANIPIHGRTQGLGILALAYHNLANNRVIESSSWPLDLMFLVLFVWLPLFISNRRKCSIYYVFIASNLGIVFAWLASVLFVMYLAKNVGLLFIIVNAITAVMIQIFLRIQILNIERIKLVYEKQAAEQANQLKSQFLSSITHELRTPLTAVLGYNKLLSDDDISNDDKKNYVNIIENNGQHLLLLINNLLDQAKLEAEQMQLELRPIDIRQTLQFVIQTMQPLAQKKSLLLQQQCKSDVPMTFSLDELRIRQVLINIVGNAIKFTEKGSVSIIVTYTQPELRFNIIDTGPGMSETALKNIFQAFQQADDSIARKHGGTGLGLSISKNLVQLMSGELTVTSTLGEGTEFSISLPVEIVEAEEKLEKPIVVLNNQEQASKKRILVVDDMPDIRALLKLFLSKMGFEVLLAENGEQALEIAISEKPDIIIMDVEMPVMSGQEAVSKLRESGFKNMILASTAHTEGHEFDSMMASGCDSFIAKPIRYDQLQQKLL